MKSIQEKTEPPQRLRAYLSSDGAFWFWATILLAIATTVTVLTVPDDSYPLVYLRYLLGLVFVLWLPGYTFIKALFPAQVPVKTSSESLDAIERVALSFGMSLALVPIVGLLLDYTPWGIRLTSVTLGLLALTLAFALGAMLRDRRTRIDQFRTRE
jgi:uncharacterized membrane protein